MLFIALGACAGCPPPGIKDHPPGPPRATVDVIETIQMNAAMLDNALFGKHISVNAKVRDERKRSHRYNLEGTLLYRRPRDLRIDLRPAIGDNVLGIGSNNEEYWMWIEADVGTMRWGRHVHVGKPCAASVALMPHQLASVLGLGLPSADEGLGHPVRRGADEYDILEYIRMSPGQNSIDREYWVERYSPFMVRKIIFRDDFGQEAMIATLNDYRRDYPQAPLAPHQIEVTWPRSDSRLRMEVSSFRAASGGQMSPKAFTRPQRAELPAGVKTIIQVDQECDLATNENSSD